MGNLQTAAAYQNREILSEYFIIIRLADLPLELLDPGMNITLARFHAKEAMEETLGRWIQNICRLQARFNLSWGPDASTTGFQLQLRDIKFLLQLANSLKIIDGFVQSNECPPVWVAGYSDLAAAIHLPNQNISLAVEKIQMVKRQVEFEKVELVNSFSLAQSLCPE